MSRRRIAIALALLVGVLTAGTVYAAHTTNTLNPGDTHETFGNACRPMATQAAQSVQSVCVAHTPTSTIAPPTNTPTSTPTPLPPTATPTANPSGGFCADGRGPTITLVGGSGGSKDSDDCILTNESISIFCSGTTFDASGDYVSDGVWRDVFCDSGSNNDHVSVRCQPTSPAPVRQIISNTNWIIQCGTVGPTATPANTPTPTNTPSGPTPTPTNVPPTPTPGGGGGNLVTITNGSGYSNMNPQANTTYRCAEGVILNGNNTINHAFNGSANGVTIENCKITNYASCFNCAAVYSEGTWLIQNNEIYENSHGGIDASGNNTIVRGNNVHHNGQYGIAGGENTGLIIENNDIHWNNNACHSGEEGCLTDAQGGQHHDARFEAGGGKVTVATDTIWRGNRVSHNSGVGLWCDESCHNTRYENNVIWNNGWGGIWHEISYRADIIGNTITDNGTCPANVACDPRSDASFWRMEVMIFNAGLQGQISEMSGNTISGPNILLVLFNQDRDEFRTWNWHIHDNGLTTDEYEFACDDVSNCAQVQNSVIFED